MFFNKRYDIVEIGEIAVDVFIRLKGNGVHTEGHENTSYLCLPFATKIPYESATEVPAVANAGNAAVSASRLGLTSALVANMGKDPNGKKCLDSLHHDRVE